MDDLSVSLTTRPMHLTTPCSIKSGTTLCFLSVNFPFSTNFNENDITVLATKFSPRQRFTCLLNYKIWVTLQERVCRAKIKDVHELRERIVDERDKPDQRIINKVVGEWWKRLRACVVAGGGGQFEHKTHISHCSRFVIFSSFLKGRLLAACWLIKMRVMCYSLYNA